MSIYSGFATRRDQQMYNKLLSQLLKTFQSHLLELIGSQQFPEEKAKYYNKIVSKMKLYQQHKYLQPKFTEFLTPLLTLTDPTRNVEKTQQKSGIQTPHIQPISRQTNKLEKIQLNKKEKTEQQQTFSMRAGHILPFENSNFFSQSEKPRILSQPSQILASKPKKQDSMPFYSSKYSMQKVPKKPKQSKRQLENLKQQKTIHHFFKKNQKVLNRKQAHQQNSDDFRVQLQQKKYEMRSQAVKNDNKKVQIRQNYKKDHTIITRKNINKQQKT